MSIVYRKTAKGQSEIETRAHRLPPRLRGALILVDGQRTDAELSRLIPVDAKATLEHLAQEAFIEVAMTLADSAPAARPAEAVRTPERPAAATSTARKEPSIESLRRDSVRALNEQLGPAAESIAIKIERAKTMPELRPLLATAAQTLRGFRGAAAADEFTTRFLGNSNG